MRTTDTPHHYDTIQEAEEGLKAAQPWFGKVDPEVLRASIDGAKAAGVGAAQISAAEKRLQEETRKDAEAQLKESMPWFGSVNADDLRASIRHASTSGVDIQLIASAEKKLAESDRAEAEAALKAAMPWFGEVDAVKLLAAIERARATGVDASRIAEAEKKLAEAQAKL